ncbi:MAG: hypothetical protein KBG85_15885 [Micropruina sp.]|nr:hypothetical protein [Micropruina sp.]
MATPSDDLRTLTALRPGEPRLERDWPPDRRRRVLDDVLRRADDPRPARSGNRRRWPAVTLAAAAAAGAAILLLAPGVLDLGRRVAVPANTPSPTAEAATVGRWLPTAPSPLRPRYDAVAAWVGEAYLVVGGFTSPCATDPTKDCPDPTALADGARYDPVRDAWTPIATPPEHVSQANGAGNPYRSSTVADGVLYVQAASGRILAYHPDGDRWERLPAAASTRAGEQRIVPGNRLVLIGHGTGSTSLTYSIWNAETRSWLARDTRTRTPGSVTSAAVTADRLVVASLAKDEGDALWLASIDLGTGRVTVTADPPVPAQRPAAVVAGGTIAWPRGAQLAGRSTGQAWFLNPATGTWTSVTLPARSSGLTGTNHGFARDWYVTTDTAVALRGQLYDPATGDWLPVPELPAPANDTVVAGGRHDVLACFGQRPSSGAARFDDRCHLLRLPPG